MWTALFGKKSTNCAGLWPSKVVLNWLCVQSLLELKQRFEQRLMADKFLSMFQYFFSPWDLFAYSHLVWVLSVQLAVAVFHV